ncbi:YHYH protein [uncultured Tateyamaria sp.]|uniref:YHYH protein n=1 Tax=uncultured Tateyamaria sp. TaxID=455651 RepID=UPI00261B609C|nr:YHYH protein [uncultured Tateyamaria sp.]
MTLSQLKTAMLIGAILLACAVQGDAQPRLRQHTTTKVEPVTLTRAAQRLSGGSVKITQTARTRTIASNGVPTHAVGRFPNSGNPNRISAQSHTFRVPVSPKVGHATPLQRGASFGVAINGVPFDPNAAEFWQGSPRSGWQYNALGGAVSLGLDANYAHVQPTGAYHYHGLPVGLMQQLGWSASAPSPLIGYAADGFPIYALTAELGGKTVRMTSSYRLKSGRRPGGIAPGGRYDGAFQQDYEYLPGSGQLDDCNGAMITSSEYPGGTYAYFLTDTYPVIPRCLVGTPGKGFAKG